MSGCWLRGVTEWNCHQLKYVRGVLRGGGALRVEISGGGAGVGISIKTILSASSPALQTWVTFPAILVRYFCWRHLGPFCLPYSFLSTLM